MKPEKSTLNQGAVRAGFRRGRVRLDPGPASPRLQPHLLRLYAAPDLPRFWTVLQMLLRDTVPYDALVVYLNFLDFVTSWKAEKIFATPNALRSPTWFEARRQVDMTPQFVLSRPKRLKLYRLSDIVPEREKLRQTAFYRNFLVPGGWSHLAVLLYWRRSSVRSEIALRRTLKQGDFTQAEMALLQELYPHLDAVLDRLLAAEEERARRRWLEDINHHLPFALMFLNWEMDPIFVNQQALEQCARWNFGPEKARAYLPRSVFHTPADIIAACSRLKAGWLERQSMLPDGVAPKASVLLVHPQQPGLTATITQQMDDSSPTAHPGFAIYLEKIVTPEVEP